MTGSGHGRTSNWETYVHLVKGNIGAGALALPFYFSMLGPFWSVIFLTLIGILSVYNMWLVVDCKRRLRGATTYGELGYAAFGHYGEYLIEFFLTLMQLSVCCVYFTFIGSNINAILPGGGSETSKKIIISLLIFPIAFISQIKSIRQLSPLSVAATLLYIIALFLIISLCFDKIINEISPELPAADFTKTLAFLSTAIYAFEGVGIILPVESAMRHPKDFSFVLALSMITVAFIFVVLAEVCLVAFGSIDDGSITSFLQRHSNGNPFHAFLISTINMLVSAAVLLTYPLQLYPAMQVLEIALGIVTPKFAEGLSVTTTTTAAAVTSSRGRKGSSSSSTSSSVSALSFFAISTSPVYKKLRKSSRLGSGSKFRPLRPLGDHSGSGTTNYFSRFTNMDYEDLGLTIVEEEGEDDSDENDDEDNNSDVLKPGSYNSSTTTERITFRAVSDSDVKSVLWKGGKDSTGSAARNPFSPIKPIRGCSTAPPVGMTTSSNSGAISDKTNLENGTVTGLQESQPPSRPKQQQQQYVSLSGKHLLNTNNSSISHSDSSSSNIIEEDPQQQQQQLPIKQNRDNTVINELTPLRMLSVERLPSSFTSTGSLQSSKPPSPEKLSASSIIRRKYTRILFRIFIVTATALVAVIVPNVGLIVALSGASSGATLSLVIPPLVDVRLSVKKLSWGRWLINFTSIFVGVSAAIIGTGLALVDIVNAYI